MEQTNPMPLPYAGMSQIRFKGSGVCRLSPKAPLVVVYCFEYSTPRFRCVDFSRDAEQGEDGAEQMRTVYLAEWKGMAPADVLWRHLLIAEELGCVYRALSWHVYVNLYRYDLAASSDKPVQWLNLWLEYRDLKRRQA